MKAEQFVEHLSARFPDHDFALDELNRDCVVVPANLIPDCLRFLRDDSETAMNYFDFSTCVDRPPDDLHLVYSMYSTDKKHRLQLKVVLDRHSPCVATASTVWTNADWNEREIYDLFGVFFTGHKDLRRLMMPEDWEGHPLRKDYAHPNLVVRPD